LDAAANKQQHVALQQAGFRNVSSASCVAVATWMRQHQPSRPGSACVNLNDILHVSCMPVVVLSCRLLLIWPDVMIWAYMWTSLSQPSHAQVSMSAQQWLCGLAANAGVFCRCCFQLVHAIIHGLQLVPSQIIQQRSCSCVSRRFGGNGPCVCFLYGLQHGQPQLRQQQQQRMAAGHSRHELDRHAASKEDCNLGHSLS